MEGQGLTAPVTNNMDMIDIIVIACTLVGIVYLYKEASN